MTFDELYDLSTEIDSRYKSVIEHIIQAEMDWEVEVETIEDFIETLEKEINGKTTRRNISLAVKKYEQNLTVCSWKAEAYSSLTKVFKYDEHKTIKEILEEIIHKTKR